MRQVPRFSIGKPKVRTDVRIRVVLILDIKMTRNVFAKRTPHGILNISIKLIFNIQN